MPRLRLEPKFTYRQECEYFYQFPYSSSGEQYQTREKLEAKDNNPGVMYFLNSSFGTSLISPFFFPQVNLPGKGNGHNLRNGNRITVTSIHWKCTLTPSQYLPLNMKQIIQYAPSDMKQVPCNNMFFMKMRYMLVQFDDDLVMTDATIYKWFKDTFCFCTAQAGSPIESDPYPVSVHSNVMRLTTPWISKFQILTDRRFVITNKHPQIDIDVTIPIKRQYIFDENETQPNLGLITPNIMLFIIGPLNWQTDVDSITRLNFADGFFNNHPLFSVHSWTKLNFIDL